MEFTSSSAHLATKLDIEMLTRNGVSVLSSSVPHSALPRKSGLEVSRELGGRPLLRYLRIEDAKRYLRGDCNRQCVTPTPYASPDLISFLNLPDPTTVRSHFLLLDPAKIPDVIGPRYIAWGEGIEYILTAGFSMEALVNPWPMEIR